MKTRPLNKYLLFLGLFLAFAFTNMACSKKTGCPVNENASAKTDKQGNYKVKKSHSGLFPKKSKKNR